MLLDCEVHFILVRGGNTGIRGYPTRKNRVSKPENHQNVYPKPDPIYFRILQYPPRVSIPDVLGTRIPDSLHVLITNKKI